MEMHGYYTFFGFSRDVELLKQRIFERLGIEVQTIDIGEAGQFYYYSTHADIAEFRRNSCAQIWFFTVNYQITFERTAASG